MLPTHFIVPFLVKTMYVKQFLKISKIEPALGLRTLAIFAFVHDFVTYTTLFVLIFVWARKKLTQSYLLALHAAKSPV